mgnify:CR=1 FL=1
MKDYSQHGEQQVVLDYFNGVGGTLLDIGANNGIIFSNSRALLELGWYGVLVEPSEKTFKELTKNSARFHKQVLLHNVGIADYNGWGEFFESGPLVSKKDYSLVSSMKETETARWRQKTHPDQRIIKFRKTKIPVIDFATLLKNSQCDTFDFITIDVEGMEVEILKQIDIVSLNCKMICLEYNGKPEIAEIYDRLIPHPVLYKNRTNIIYAKSKAGLITL